MNYRIHIQNRRRSFPSLVTLLGLTLLSSSIFAAPPNPPVFTALDGDLLEHPNPDGRYSLDDATHALPFAVNTPRPPQIVAEHVVTPSTLGNYINTPGVRLVLEPGSYGNRTFSSQNQEIILREGVFFGSVTIGGSARRVAIRTEVPRSGNMVNISMLDWGTLPENILIDGINSDDGGNRNFIHGNRVAIINSFIRTVDYPLSAFNAEYNDVIIANCDLQAYGSTQAGVRLQGTNRLVFVDNRIRKTGSGHNAFRLHGQIAQIEHAYIARNQIEGPRMIITAGGSNTGHGASGFRNVWVEDNSLYMLPNGTTALETAANFGVAQEIDNMSLRNNAAFGVTSVWTHPATNNYPGWAISGNTVAEYITPPRWGFQ